MPAVDDWDLAPCGLLEINSDRTITRANERFLARTGYTREDVARGLSWTSLMTPAGRILYDTQFLPMLALNGSLDEIMMDIVCSDGHRLPVLLSAVMSGADPTATGRTRLALMTVPDRRQYEGLLREARQQAELANEANLQVRKRLELLASANSALASSLDVEAALGGLARVLVGELADWCLVYAIDPDHPRESPRWSAAHVDADRQADLDRLAPLLPLHATDRSVLKKVLAGAAPVLLSEITLDDLQLMTTSEDVFDLLGGLDLRSVLVVPSTARAQQTAVIVVVRGAGRPRFTDEDLAELADLAERTGIAIDNLRLYARERSISVGLQKALLTPLPEHERLELASRYVPGANGSEIGGDWYDAFRQADGTTVVVVGDVIGHDIEAASAMGHLRGVIRTIGHTTSGTPAQTLARADRAADGLLIRVVASAVVASLRAPGPAERAAAFAVQWSSAGHLPPLLVPRTGPVEILAGRPDLLLGVYPDRRRRDFELEMRTGDTLVLYTDGLVERRDEDLEDSIARLAAGLAGTADRTLDELCERALEQRPPRNNDDVALLAVRVGQASRLSSSSSPRPRPT